MGNPHQRGGNDGLENKDRARVDPTDRTVIGIGREAHTTYANEEEAFMADTNKSGPAEAVKGVVEDVKGRAKEAVGAVTGQDDLTREGQAQQDKAEAQRNAAKKEAEAEAARGGAAAAEERQKSNQ
jgi:uncharacterized protein YjbJ (UPF0337 family)